jgi:hypothetical protein
VSLKLSLFVDKKGGKFLHSQEMQLKIFSLPCQALLWNFPEELEKDLSRSVEAQGPLWIDKDGVLKLL